MKALRKQKPMPGADLVDIQIPEPGEHELLIKVKATAICKSDVEVIEWTPLVASANYDLPFTMGHEFSGEVEAVGKFVKNFKKGDRVAGETHIPCGYCRECRTDNQHICTNHMGVLGRTVDGSFAEYIKIPEISAIKLADDANFEHMSLLEPMGTALHALQKAEPSGKIVAVLGVGTIGLMACELAKLLGAFKVIAMDVNEKRLAHSLSLGADIAINGLNTDLVQTAMNETNGQGVDCVLDFTGNVKVINQAIDILAPTGILVHIGMVPESLTISNYMYRVVYRELKITGLYGRHMFKTWETLMRLVNSGKINMDAYVGMVLPMDEYEKALEQFNTINGRAILIP